MTKIGNIRNYVENSKIKENQDSAKKIHNVKNCHDQT